MQLIQTQLYVCAYDQVFDLVDMICVEGSQELCLAEEHNL